MVKLTVFPVIFARPLDLIVGEVAFVIGTVCETKDAFAVFLSVLVLTLVLSAIRPGFNSPPVLLVFVPLAHVLGPVVVCVCALAMRLIIDPFALIHVPVRVFQSSVPIGSVPFPIPLVH